MKPAVHVTAGFFLLYGKGSEREFENVTNLLLFRKGACAMIGLSKTVPVGRSYRYV
jgi:hypothetical protein